MKLNIFRAVVLSWFCITMMGCKKDFLTIVPEGKQVAVTTEDYRLLMADPGLAFANYAGGWQGQAIMGDDMAAELPRFTTAQFMTQAAFRWEDLIFREQDNDFTTSGMLENLYQLNKVINEVQKSTGGTQQMKDELQAQAQANRAWIYFQLINMYGKPYVAAEASTDPGFPIILTADITEKEFTRNTVQEVYDFIIRDFTTAMPNLPVNPATGIQFNKSAAEGLLGKVYLFMGKPAEALTAFESAMSDNAQRATPARLYDYVKEFAAGGKFTPLSYNGPNNSPGNNLYDFTESLVSQRFYNGPWTGNGFGNDPFVLDPKSESLFKSSDLRLKFYAAQFPYNSTNPSGRLRKYAMTYGSNGLQISELYLLRAEARARQNNLTGAVADVETLRTNRMSADVAIPTTVAADRTALIKYIFDERVREFSMEGYRWFDMRRQSVDPLFTGQVHTHTMYNYSAGTSTQVTLRKERLTMKLPLFLSNANPGMVDNP